MAWDTPDPGTTEFLGMRGTQNKDAIEGKYDKKANMIRPYTTNVIGCAKWSPQVVVLNIRKQIRATATYGNPCRGESHSPVMCAVGTKTRG
jgi:hypothetical protein